MMDRGQKTLQHIGGAEADTAGVDAGVTAEIFLLVHIPIDEQMHPVFPIVGQTHDGDGSRRQIQIVPHMIFIRKGKAGASDLGGQFLGFERLVPGHQEQIKGAPVAVAQKQVLTHPCAEGAVDGGAGLHSEGGLVIDPIVGEGQGIQQGIAGLLLGDAGFVVGIAAVDGHSVSPIRGFLDMVAHFTKKCKKKAEGNLHPR